MNPDSDEKLLLYKLPQFLIVSSAEEFLIEEIRDKRGGLLTTVILVPDFHKAKKIFKIDLKTKKFISIEF